MLSNRRATHLYGASGYVAPNKIKTREELTAKHGTPKEFERAVWAAWAQLFVTTAEAEKAIVKYRDEWLAAPVSRT